MVDGTGIFRSMCPSWYYICSSTNIRRTISHGTAMLFRFCSKYRFSNV